MKTVFKNLLFWLCALTLVLNVTACSDDDENKAVIYKYIASGSIISVGSIEESVSTLTAIPDYTAAIEEAMGGSYVTQECDDRIIAACDKVYESQRAAHPNWKGEIVIERVQGTASPDEEAPSTVIKTYKYE